MPYQNYPPDEVARRGEALYERKIRASVEAGHDDEFVIIDIETGDYEVDADDLAATDRMLARRPNAILYGLRVGHATAHRLGGVFPTQHR